MIAKEALHRAHFGLVAERRRGAVRVDVTNVRHGEFSVAQRGFHRLVGAGALLIGRRDMERVTGRAVASELSVDARAALLRVFEFFEHDDRRAFRKHEAIAILVEGSRRSGWIVVARRQRLHRRKCGEREWRDGRFSAACNHDVTVAALNRLHCDTHRVTARRAGRSDSGARPAEIELDRNVAGRSVDHEARHHEWAHAARASLQELGVALFHREDAADARADDRAVSVRISGVLEIETGILHGFMRRNHREKRNAVDALLLAAIHDVRWIEVVDFACKANGPVFVLREASQRRDAGLASLHRRPRRGRGRSEVRDGADTGDDDSAERDGLHRYVLQRPPASVRWMNSIASATVVSLLAASSVIEISKRSSNSIINSALSRLSQILSNSLARVTSVRATPS